MEVREQFKKVSFFLHHVSPGTKWSGSVEGVLPLSCLTGSQSLFKHHLLPIFRARGKGQYNKTR